MALVASNNLRLGAAASRLCKAFGIRLVKDTQVVQLAKNAGFDALFIEMEHSNFSLEDTGSLCRTALQIGITPFVRVPYQCGDGFVQRALDGGAMGVIFPHIHTRRDAEAAVSISKYPPWGKRSMTGQLPTFGLRPTPTDKVVVESNAEASSVLLMVETKESVSNIEDIASVEGVDVLLIGSNDLSIELGVPGLFKSDEFRSALERVSSACKKSGKIFGLAGIYENRELQQWAINTLGAGFILGQQDSGLLARSSQEVTKALLEIAQESRV
ncbi:Pyruvate/Phosphoenolpyruvate kinase-like domain-containing protein [Astrocystis sublimbata]|nr:Pyruvate/Phosphoenolpyruvate kinase-like domain-containing protein [Astrocystis sublimbata]